MRATRYVLAAVLAAGIVTMASAQPGGRQGGFGGGGPDFISLYSNTAMQDELKMTDAQKKRLKQLAVQQMGMSVFNDTEAKAGKGNPFGGLSAGRKALMKDVQEAMKLTDSQKSNMKSINDDYRKDSQEIYKDANVGRGKDYDPEKAAAAQKKVAKVRKEADEKVMELFTDSQKKTWTDLTGEPVDFSKFRPAPPAKKD